jgi:hypothetical protein
VSSVLNRDTKLFGKQHMLDGSDETCWNSHQVHHTAKLAAFWRPPLQDLTTA